MLYKERVCCCGDLLHFVKEGGVLQKELIVKEWIVYKCYVKSRYIVLGMMAVCERRWRLTERSCFGLSARGLHVS